KLIITDYHRSAARQVHAVLGDRLGRGTLAITISGESGAGKTEIAHCLAELLDTAGRTSLVLSQDDYFRLPPHSNHRKRESDIDWVGTGEVRLDLLDEHVAALKAGLRDPLVKPLVHFEEDRIGEETVAPAARDAIIVEGTYTGLLASADVRIFIDRTYLETRANRIRRGRDSDSAFLERVLAIEHKIISKQKTGADVVIPPPGDESD
ncbi:MAG: uridine kinase family protein, partial [Planctomycetota bacterium]